MYISTVASTPSTIHQYPYSLVSRHFIITCNRNNPLSCSWNCALCMHFALYSSIMKIMMAWDLSAPPLLASSILFQCKKHCFVKSLCWCIVQNTQLPKLIFVCLCNNLCRFLVSFHSLLTQYVKYTITSTMELFKSCLSRKTSRFKWPN